MVYHKNSGLDSVLTHQHLLSFDFDSVYHNVSMFIIWSFLFNTTLPFSLFIHSPLLGSVWNSSPLLWCYLHLHMTSVSAVPPQTHSLLLIDVRLWYVLPHSLVSPPHYSTSLTRGGFRVRPSHWDSERFQRKRLKGTLLCEKHEMFKMQVV